MQSTEIKKLLTLLEDIQKRPVLTEADQPDMSRRNFLRTAGKAAAAGAAMATSLKSNNANASTSDVEKIAYSLIGAINAIGPAIDFLKEKDVKLFTKINNIMQWAWNVLNKPIGTNLSSPEWRNSFIRIAGENKMRADDPIKTCYYVYDKYIVPYARALAKASGSTAPL